MKSHSEAFHAFLENLKHPPALAELTYPLQPYKHFTEAEKLEAGVLLTSRILEHGDIRAMLTVAALGDQKAIPALEHAAKAEPPHIRGTANLALARLKGDKSAITQVIHDLKEGPDSVRTAAAYELARLDRPDATLALIDALSDPLMTVRVHAIEGSLRQLGLEPLAEPRESPLSTLQVKLYTCLAAVYVPAAKTLKELLLQVLEGKSPKLLKLVPQQSTHPDRLQRFVRSMLKEAYQVDLLPTLSPQERAWAEAITVAALDRQDPRAAVALAQLKLTDAVPALKEAVERPDVSPAFQAAVTSALESLQPSA